MTFGLRSLGARSSGRKEPSGRRHRLQTAMASLPQNESMGKILRDVCCKLLSSALLRSDGESVFMLTAESRQRSCAPFCTWQREVETERGAVVPIEPGSFERNKARWHKRLKPRHEASKVNSRCIAPTFGHALTLPDLAPPSSLGFLTVSQRHCQSAGKKKRTAGTLPDPCLRVPKSMGYASVEHPLYSSHLITESRKRSPVLQPLQDDQPLPAFPEHCTLGPGGDESSNATKAVRNQACAFGASCRHWQLPKILEPFQGIYLLYLFPESNNKKVIQTRGDIPEITRNHQKSRWRETVGSVTTDPEWWCKGQAAASTVQNAGSHIEFFVLSPMLQINCDHRALLGLCLATSSCFFGVACFFANAWISTPESTWGPNAFGHTSLSNWQCHGARTREAV